MFAQRFQQASVAASYFPKIQMSIYRFLHLMQSLHHRVAQRHIAVLTVKKKCRELSKFTVGHILPELNFLLGEIQTIFLAVMRIFVQHASSTWILMKILSLFDTGLGSMNH